MKQLFAIDLKDHVAMIFRYGADDKKYLYDIMNIKKKRAIFSGNNRASKYIVINY